MSTPRKRAAPSLCLALSALLALAALAGPAAAAWENRALREEFSGGGRSRQYLQGVPVEEMDWDSLAYCFQRVETANAVPVDNRVSLPFPIPYYTMEEGELVPAAVIPPGTEILWLPKPEMHSWAVGYGLHSLPTYERGWRYALPFLTEETAALGGEPLFVRLETLEALAGEIYRSSPQVRKQLSRQAFTRRYLLQADLALFREGEFLSADLYWPLWPLSSTALLCLSAAALLFGLYLRMRGGGQTLFQDKNLRKSKTRKF